MYSYIPASFHECRETKDMYPSPVHPFNISTAMFNKIIPDTSGQHKFSCIEHLLSTFPVTNSQHWYAIENCIHVETAVRLVCVGMICL